MHIGRFDMKMPTVSLLFGDDRILLILPFLLSLSFSICSPSISVYVLSTSFCIFASMLTYCIFSYSLYPIFHRQPTLFFSSSLFIVRSFVFNYLRFFFRCYCSQFFLNLLNPFTTHINVHNYSKLSFMYSFDIRAVRYGDRGNGKDGQKVRKKTIFFTSHII